MTQYSFQKVWKILLLHLKYQTIFLTCSLEIVLKSGFETFQNYVTMWKNSAELLEHALTATLKNLFDLKHYMHGKLSI